MVVYKYYLVGVVNFLYFKIFLNNMAKRIPPTKDYQAVLFRTPMFWVGAVIFILGFVFAIIGLSPVLYIVFLLAGLLMMAVIKYRVVTDLKE